MLSCAVSCLSMFSFSSAVATSDITRGWRVTPQWHPASCGSSLTVSAHYMPVLKVGRCHGCLLPVPSSSLSLEDKEADRRQAPAPVFYERFPSSTDIPLTIAYYQLYSRTSSLVSITTGLICTLTQLDMEVLFLAVSHLPSFSLLHVPTCLHLCVAMWRSMLTTCLCHVLLSVCKTGTLTEAVCVGWTVWLASCTGGWEQLFSSGSQAHAALTPFLWGVSLSHLLSSHLFTQRNPSAGEMAQGFRHSRSSEDLGSNPSTPIMAPSHLLNPVPGNPTPPSYLCGHCTHVVHRHVRQTAT